YLTHFTFNQATQTTLQHKIVAKHRENLKWTSQWRSQDNIRHYSNIFFASIKTFSSPALFFPPAVAKKG
ncbi:MAG: hypothetical protein RL086_1093, partial [Bacteroidota bacterium]